MNFTTSSEDETTSFGRYLGEIISAPVTLLLEGDLGVGKSVVARGLARGLGVADDVPITSPTFTLMNHYPARVDLYHFDLYRLVDPDELIEIGFDDFAYNLGVSLVEWPERLDQRNFDHLQIRISRIAESERAFTLTARGEGPCHLLTSVETWLTSR